MKLLPKKEIDVLKANERKIEIDEGLTLARKVDALRETKVNEEKSLMDWRNNSIKAVQNEIAQFIEERDNLERQNNEARKIRDALLQPDIIQVKAELASMVNSELSKRESFISEESAKSQTKKLKIEREKVAQITATALFNQNETEKAKQEAERLQKLAQKTLDDAKSERIEQNKKYAEEIEKADQKQEEYEVALSLIQIREKEVEEKLADIIIREQHLASQQLALKIAMEEVTKSNASRN